MNRTNEASSRLVVATMSTRADLPQPHLTETPPEWTGLRVAVAIVVGTPTLVASVAWSFYSLIWLDDAAWSAQRSCTTSGLAPLSVGLPIGAFAAVGLGCALLDRAMGRSSWPKRARWILIALPAMVVLVVGTSRWWASQANVVHLTAASAGYGLVGAVPLYFLTAVFRFPRTWRAVSISVVYVLGLGLAVGLMWLGKEHWHVCPPMD